MKEDDAIERFLLAIKVIDTFIDEYETPFEVKSDIFNAPMIF